MLFSPTYPHDLNLLPPKVKFSDEKINKLLLKASRELAELKGYSSTIPNLVLLLSPAIIKESLASSKIENINTTIVNVLQNQLFPEIEQRSPDKEVLHYRDAVIDGFASVKKFVLSTRTINKIHQVLLPDNSTGYRTTQNGIKNTKTSQIIYTPPIVAKLPELMNNLETFMNDKREYLDPLIKCAILHYQFEAIHPFGDGNGRTGRILMVLYLAHTRILSHPILYISDYINANRNDYYRLLLEVTTKQNWNEYVAFILKGFYLQAKATKELLLKIRMVYVKLRNQLRISHKAYASELAEALCSYPFITPAKLSQILSVHRDTSSRYLSDLAKQGVLMETKVGKYHLFAYKELLDILNK